MLKRNQNPPPQPVSPQVQVLVAQRDFLNAQLSANGSTEMPPDVLIECANGHKYRAGGFYFDGGIEITTEIQQVSNKFETSVTPFMQIWPSSSMSGSTQQAVPITTGKSTVVFGCPSCHTDLFSVCDPKYAGYQNCPEHHFYGPLHQTCPTCEIRAQLKAIYSQLATFPPGPPQPVPVYYPSPNKSRMPNWLHGAISVGLLIMLILAVSAVFSSCGRL